MKLLKPLVAVSLVLGFALPAFAVGAPVITLLGSSVVNLTVGDSYIDAGATAVDDLGNDITQNIVLGGSVDTSNVGTYMLTYDVNNSTSTPPDAVQVTRTVNVSAPAPTPAPEPTPSAGVVVTSGVRHSVAPTTTGQVLGAFTYSPEVQAQIDAIKGQLAGLIAQLIQILQSQLASVNQAGH